MYDHKSIEKKWQGKWRESGIYRASDDSAKPKKYILTEFPYPSGVGLHMGHLRGYAAGDVISRYLRMTGHEVMFATGWDAFGLPAENFAIKTGIQPAVSTAQNIANVKRQMTDWGLSFDWDREINTTDPDYYKWTQWLFLQFFKHGLAFQKSGVINWCPKDKTGLANEEVVDGKCERCGTPVEKREMKQWYLKITAYAQKLLDGLKDLDWPEAVKVSQENWIGRSEGALVRFHLAEKPAGQEKAPSIEVFTTRPDTLFGATYLVLAPDHELVGKITADAQRAAVEEYAKSALLKPELERTAIDKEKTGVFTGAYAVNPATEEPIPVWVADYVLSGYGTGAVMAVPAHDERDFMFAEKYELKIKRVVAPDPAEKIGPKVCWTGEGTLVNSGEYNFMESQEARKHIAADFGTAKVQYRLRDWVFSRQRYWGEPIPLVHCQQCGVVPVPEDQLPVILPEVEKYEPTGTGESPLAAVESWVSTSCPKCQGPARRETDTMPQWAGSSWYYLRYADPRNPAAFAAKDKLQRWQPVDMYFGGMEHTTLHLLYSRFWNLFLYDQGLVTVPEPYLKRVPHGIILGPDGEKMSKSRGNVVNPDEVVESDGADALRMYEMFLGPHDAMVAWNGNGISGVRRFLERVYACMPDGAVNDGQAGEGKAGFSPAVHRLAKRITDGIESMRLNTCISSFMEHLNANPQMSRADLEAFVRLLAPFAPHLAEEKWAQLGHQDSVHVQPWPQFDPALLEDKTVTVAVQVMGKLRGTLEVQRGTAQEKIEAQAKSNAKIAPHLADREILKVVFVPDRLINFVVR